MDASFGIFLIEVEMKTRENGIDGVVILKSIEFGSLEEHERLGFDRREDVSVRF